MFDTIIIGSGPAGLAAAIYGERAKLKMLVVEKQPMSGGQILNTYEVDNYPGLPGISGFEMGMKFRKHAEKMGVNFVRETVKQIEKEDDFFRIITDKETYQTKTVILATGAGYRKLEIPGETEFLGKGVSYCATCDGAFFREKVVAVVGGGDVALEDALFLSRSCKKVYLIHRRDTFRGAKVLQEKVKETENIEILYNAGVTEIQGEAQVKEITVFHKLEETKEQLQVDGIFVAIGIIPNTGLVEGMVAMDENGYILAPEDGKTSVDGLFAAGDIRNKPLRQVITAAADGANTITSVEKYLYHI